MLFYKYMTHSELLQHCIEMQQKRIAYFRAKKRKQPIDYNDSVTKQLFEDKTNANLVNRYPNVEMANTKKELLAKYGNTNYIEELKKLNV